MDTSELVVRDYVVLIHPLQGLKSEQVQVPLIWKVGLQVADFTPDGDGA